MHWVLFHFTYLFQKSHKWFEIGAKWWLLHFSHVSAAGEMFYINSSTCWRMKHYPPPGPEAWLLLHVIIHLLIIILIYFIPYSYVSEQIHLHNPSKGWAIHLSIDHVYLYDSIYSITQPHIIAHISDRLTHFSSFTRKTDCAWGGGWPRQKAAAELTGSGVILNGLLCLPVFPQVITAAADNRQREWMSFIPARRFHLSDHSRSYQTDQSACTDVGKWATCVCFLTDTQIHTCTGSDTTPHFPDLTLDVSGMQHRDSNEFISARSFVFTCHTEQ